MPFVKRGRNLKDEDVLDPTEMNEDFQPYVELLSGNVDAENISGTDFKANVTVGQDAYYTPYYEQVICLPRFGAINSTKYDGGVAHPNFLTTSADVRGDVAGFSSTNVQVIPNAAGWVPLGGGDKLDVSGGTTSFKVTTGDTGESNLWINATVQYVWNGFGFDGDEDSQFKGTDETSTGYNGAPIRFVPTVEQESRRPSLGGVHHISMGYYSARMQFAIRLDGQVLEQTITGKRSEYETSPLGVRHVTTRELSGSGSIRNAPGPRGFERRAVGLGPEMLAVRIGTVIRVSPGTHTVEIMARRIAPRGQRNAIARDRVGVHNRQLSVIELPIHEGTTIPLDNTSVPALNAEDKLELESRVGAVVSQTNDMKRQHVKTGSLRNEHLPSRVLSTDQTHIDPTDARNYTTASFVNEASSLWEADSSFAALNTTTRAGGQGWFLVTGETGKFTVDNTVAVADDSLLIVMADLRLKTINVRTETGTKRIPLENRLLDSFAGFAIGYSESETNDTTWRIDPASRAYVNSFNWIGRATHFVIAFGEAAAGKPYSSVDMRNRPATIGSTPYIEDTFENVNISLMWIIHDERLREGSVSGGSLRDIKRVGVFCAGAASPTGGVNSGPEWKEDVWYTGGDSRGDAVQYYISPPKIRWGRGALSLLHLKR